METERTIVIVRSDQRDTIRHYCVDSDGHSFKRLVIEAALVTGQSWEEREPDVIAAIVQLIGVDSPDNLRLVPLDHLLGIGRTALQRV